MEREILAAAIGSRDAHDLLESRGVSAELSPAASIIFEAVTNYYNTDESAEYANVSLILKVLGKSHPKYIDQFSKILEDLPDVSAANAVELWLQEKRQVIGSKLATSLVNNDKESVIDDLIEEYKFYQNYQEEKPRTFIGAHPSEIVTSRKTGSLIPLYPRSLNLSIGGGLDRGSHVVLFGVPEMGKTQVVLNAVAVMIQRGFKVLYCWNEDPVKKVMDRYLARLSDIPAEDLRQDTALQDRAYRAAMTKGYDNLILQEIMPGTFTELRSLIEEHSPDVLVVDQIRNLHYRDTNGLTDILERAGKDMRNFAKRYDIVTVSVTQAGDTAQGKAVLQYNDVEYSNVGLAATADLMVGIGATKDMYAESKIVLSISKNKLNGNHAVIPARVFRPISKLWSIEEVSK